MFGDGGCKCDWKNFWSASLIIHQGGSLKVALSKIPIKRFQDKTTKLRRRRKPAASSLFDTAYCIVDMAIVCTLDSERLNRIWGTTESPSMEAGVSWASGELVVNCVK